MLFHPGAHTPLAVAAKLRPIIVLSTREEIEAVGSALVIPCSAWVPSDFTAAQAKIISGNQVPHLHWLPASRSFAVIGACTLDFRWTYRLSRELLLRARKDAPERYPRGPVARLRDEMVRELLKRFCGYVA